VAVSGWVLDKSAAVRIHDPVVGRQLAELAGTLYVCPVGALEQLYSARSARDYDARRDDLHASYDIVPAPRDIFERALRLQRDLAHHHGLWHRIPIPDLLIAETALHHGLGIVHVDGDFDRIAAVRPLVVRRLGARAGW
jgi:predicted nucleic acid-binding protein